MYCFMHCAVSAAASSPPHIQRDTSRTTPQLHTLHVTDTVNPAEGSHTGVDSMRAHRRSRQTHWHPAALLATSHAEALVSCYLFLVGGSEGLYLPWGMAYIWVSLSNCVPREQSIPCTPADAVRAPCYRHHRHKELRFSTDIFTDNPFKAMPKIHVTQP